MLPPDMIPELFYLTHEKMNINILPFTTNTKLIERSLYDNGRYLCLYLKYEYKLCGKTHYLTIPRIALKFAGVNYRPDINAEASIGYDQEIYIPLPYDRIEMEPCEEGYVFATEERRVHYGPRSFKQVSKRDKRCHR